MQITDWTKAYDNRGHVPGSENFEPTWRAEAQAFRDRQSAGGRAELDIRYGEADRNLMDLFRPEGDAKGLVVFIHGGYWRLFDKSVWSHFAEGAVAKGWAVAVPSYTLVPEVPIAEITYEIGDAITAAAEKVAGDIRVTGHSAGGHLAARMMCSDTPLAKAVTDRIRHCMPISGVHDLRPLVNIAFNEDFNLTPASAAEESPALKTPIDGARVTAWIGDAELPEFVRQSTLLANVWTGLGANMTQVKAEGDNHFSVIEPLRDPASRMIATLLDISQD